MKEIIKTAWLSVVLMIVSGCAFDVIKVEQVPASLLSPQTCVDSFTLAKNIDINLGGGYSRTLRKGTAWNCIGRIKQGNVYKTTDQILTVEASNVYEANIVVTSGKLVGFYLFVEGTFSPLDNKIQLVTNPHHQSPSTGE